MELAVTPVAPGVSVISRTIPIHVETMILMFMVSMVDRQMPGSRMQDRIVMELPPPATDWTVRIFLSLAGVVIPLKG